MNLATKLALMLALVLGVLSSPARAEAPAGEPACASAKNEEEAKACFLDFLSKLDTGKPQDQGAPQPQDTCTYCRNQETSCLIFSWTCGPFYAICAGVCCTQFNDCAVGGGCGFC